MSLYARTRNRGPVSWPALFLVSVAAASAVAYYSVERERRLERAMGKVVSSESDGWTPRPDYLAKRKFVATKAGWFPVDDGFGAREFTLLYVFVDASFDDREANMTVQSTNGRMLTRLLLVSNCNQDSFWSDAKRMLLCRKINEVEISPF